MAGVQEFLQTSTLSGTINVDAIPNIVTIESLVGSAVAANADIITTWAAPWTGTVVVRIAIESGTAPVLSLISSLQSTSKQLLQGATLTVGEVYQVSLAVQLGETINFQVSQAVTLDLEVQAVQDL